MSTLDAALDYLRHGWAVFPCRSRAKEPLTEHGVLAATLDEATFRGWWRRSPTLNVAIATGAKSGIVVLDVDPRHGGDESLAALEAEHGKLPATVECLTGGGGRHLYFKHPGGTVKNAVGLGGCPGLDVRGDGGFVIAPPSTHPSGNRYEWELSSSPDTTPLADLPAWLLLMMRPLTATQWRCAEPIGERIPKGQQHTTLVSLAGTMRHRGMNAAEIEAALLVTNAQRLEDPAPPEDIRRIAQSVCTLYEPGETIPPKCAKGAIAQIPWRSSATVGALGQNDCLLGLETYHVRCFTDVQPEQVRWLWPSRIPLGKITVLDGDPGLGKSLLTLDLAARLSTGRPMPDGTQSDIDTPTGVLLLSAEDDAGDTIRPRLDAAGADLSRVSILTHVTSHDEAGQEQRRFPSIPADLPMIEAAINDAAAKLVVVDPLMAFLGSQVDAHRDQDIRRALATLMAVAERAGAAILIVRHLNKMNGVNPLYRGGGSIGIVGAARAGLLVAKDPDDTTGARRVLASTKSNLAREAESLAYHLAEGANGAALVEWDGVTAQTASTLLASTAEDGEALADAKAFLADLLDDGPRPAKAARSEAKAAGLSDRTLDRAKVALGVRAAKDGFSGGWVWSLPEATKHTAQERQENTKNAKESELWRSWQEVGALGKKGATAYGDDDVWGGLMTAEPPPEEWG